MNWKNELSRTRRRVLTFLDQYITEHHRPPTYREIAEGVRLSTPSAAVHQVKQLARMGFVTHEPGITRGLALTEKGWAALGKGIDTLREAANLFQLPIRGNIVASAPVLMGDDDFGTGEDETIALDSNKLPRSGREKLYAMRVRGNSMTDALIQDRDIVVLQQVDDPKELRNGDMVAAWLRLEQEMTLKHYHLEGKMVRLQPASPDPTHEPIITPADNAHIQGKVISVHRQTA